MARTHAPNDDRKEVDSDEESCRFYAPPVYDNYDSRQMSFLESLLCLS
jgi:hypothetical protein